ncbi:unnamed protein product [Urochloa decumbens]|uniref:WRKY domain-containing protein n=1 Tax=Urochloa decumbens TaxID=240449 RepID=A0ABC9BTK0_9POAL
MADGGESCGGGRARLVSELCRVQDLVRRLELQLRAPSDPASVDLCRRLVHDIIALTDRSISMARSGDLAAHLLPAAHQPPLSGAPSPLSDAGSDQHHPFRASPKKRKATARWASQQVRVAAAAGAAEGPADDGHSWRKYGQKDILGAKHPRAYYRCTHRNSQGCPATKQVQRTDGDASLFDVVYHGDHTCRPNSSSSAATGARRAPPHPHPQQQHNPQAQAALQGLAARLTVATGTDAAIIGGATAAAPMTPPESCPAQRGAASPWSMASPVGSDSNGVSPCPVAPGYCGDNWGCDGAVGGDLQEVVSAFAAVSSGVAHLPPALEDELIPLECFGFDQSFDMGNAMPSFFYQ